MVRGANINTAIVKSMLPKATGKTLRAGKSETAINSETSSTSKTGNSLTSSPIGEVRSMRPHPRSITAMSRTVTMVILPN